VSTEVPFGPKQCEIQQIVFEWTMRSFPFSLKTTKKLKLRGQYVIVITGKAFCDAAHAPADDSNRRAGHARALCV